MIDREACIQRSLPYMHGQKKPPRSASGCNLIAARGPSSPNRCRIFADKLTLIASHIMHSEFAMQKRLRSLVGLSVFALITVFASAEVRLPKLLSDHMVLQREAPIHIWGWSDPGEQVSVQLHTQNISTRASDLGVWSVYLAPEPAGGPFELIVHGTNRVTIPDILIGDVWFASGQSNMEIPLNGYPGLAVIKNAAQEIAQANHPEIRLLTIPKRSSFYPLDDVDAGWTICTPATIGQFSAVAYFFGRELHEREHVPVGIIDATWGGTPGEAWVSLDALSSESSLMPVFAIRAQMTDSWSTIPLVVAEEKRKELAAKAAGRPIIEHAWHADPTAWAPGGIFNGMVAPETAYSIKGVIWYQGESNSLRALAPMYQRVFRVLIADWREKWHEGDFPFLFVQLSSFEPSASEDQIWGLIREAQRRALSLTNTAMAVSLDVGLSDNVHPPDKQTVGHRLALAARGLVYHEPIEYSGPLFRRATPEGSYMRVWFDHDEGLASRTTVVQGFEIADDDHHFVPATAHLVDGSVTVSSPRVTKPKYVRYGWANYAVTSLVNGAGLPVSTFTSEDELLLTQRPQAHF